MLNSESLQAFWRNQRLCFLSELPVGFLLPLWDAGSRYGAASSGIKAISVDVSASASPLALPPGSSFSVLGRKYAEDLLPCASPRGDK